MTYLSKNEKIYLELKKLEYSDKKIAWYLLLTQLKFILFNKKIPVFSSPSVFNIAFRIYGGIGNTLIHANFIKYFCEYINVKDISINVYGLLEQEVSDTIFNSQDFTNIYYSNSDLNENNFEYFDLVIDMHYIPNVIKANLTTINTLSPKLFHLIEKWINFKNDHRYNVFYAYDSHLYEYGIINSKNCLNIADITNDLKIKDFSINVKILKNEENVLSKLNLEKNNFITVQRGQHSANKFSGSIESTKMWPLDHYEALIILLKQRYPKIKIIQLGESLEGCTTIKGVDINLIGKTDWEDLKILLKNALYHVDGEYGMIHLRKALKSGPSVVLFGPTPKDFFGYSDNINISTSECNHWCAEIVPRWKDVCILGDQPKCMHSITPELVIAKIDQYENYKKYSSDFSISDEINHNNKIIFDKK